jgi:hypothetical protein
MGYHGFMGDFNLLLEAEDKSNPNLLGLCMTGKFSKVVDDLFLNDILLNGGAFTWTNDKQNTTRSAR